MVERTLAWSTKYRRRVMCYERRADVHEAFLHLGCYLTWLNYLLQRFCKAHSADAPSTTSQYAARV